MPYNGTQIEGVFVLQEILKYQYTSTDMNKFLCAAIENIRL